jgi:hypothetical protein
MIFHCFYCNNIDKQMLSLHQEAAKLAGITVKYARFETEALRRMGVSPHEAHGRFIESIILQHPSQIVGIIDIDCIVANSEFVQQCEDKVRADGTILGLAQTANHLPSRDEIYAAPAFMMINTDAWHEMGRPSLFAHDCFDTAQKFSHELKAAQKLFTVIMPDCHSGIGTSWPLADQGSYGIGTLYGDRQVFHLFQSSKGPSYIHLMEEAVATLRQGSSSF